MDIESFFVASSNIPRIPKLTQDLIASIDDDELDTCVFADQIALDQNLSIKLLGMANSAYYAPDRNITSVNEAVVTVGFDAIRNLVMASTLTEAFNQVEGIDIKAFWRSGFSTAVVARELAKSEGLNAETAFTCGILHNIGELLLHMQLPVQAMEVLQGVQLGEDRLELEQQIIGITYPELGAALVEHWHFPELICQAIAEQASPVEGDTHSKYAALLYLANYYIHNHDLNRDELLQRFPEGLAVTLDSDCQQLFNDMQIAELTEPFESML